MTLLVSDTGPIISLLLVDLFDIIEKLFPDYLIPDAVWKELTNHNEILPFKRELSILSQKSRIINDYYFPISGIDKGETETIILCKNLNADILLIDDKKARQKAELLGIKCIGTLGLLYFAKQKMIIHELRPIFMKLIENKRYYSKKYINMFLTKSEEFPI
ncbi:nucleotide-binding protein [Candidatus Magnetomorum sp. HK-1]|nr:nucleotide-binding protein [Candidatus Magnetomorum sp. HK-1]